MACTYYGDVIKDVIIIINALYKKSLVSMFCDLNFMPDILCWVDDEDFKLSLLLIQNVYMQSLVIDRRFFFCSALY